MRGEAAAPLEHVDDADDVPRHAVRLARRLIARFAGDDPVNDRADLGEPVRSDAARLPEVAVFLRERGGQIHASLSSSNASRMRARSARISSSSPGA